MTNGKKNTKRQTGKKTIPMANVSKGHTMAPKYSRPRRGGRGSRGQNEVVVSGRDLVVPTPQNLPTGAPEAYSVFQVVPANPTYWEGTRVQKIAQTYQLYRPLKFVVHYHPQVPVTNPGVVVYGTLFQDQATTQGALQQVLNTSNGGGIKECYTPFVSRVNVSDTFLQMRTYNTCGSASDTANCPFTWVASYSGYAESAITASSCPGWVEVEWTYRFVNGLPGPGNSSKGMFVADTAQIESYNRRLPRGAPRFNWSAPFGIPIGILKTAFEPLLRHVTCVLLKDTQVGQAVLGVGKAVNWMLEQAGMRSGTTLVSDDTGRTLALPDDTPVVVFQSGMPQASLEMDGLETIESIDITVSGVGTTGSSDPNLEGHFAIADPSRDGSEVDMMGNVTLNWVSDDDQTTFNIQLTNGTLASGYANVEVRINDKLVAKVARSSYVSSGKLYLIQLSIYDIGFKWREEL